MKKFYLICTMILLSFSAFNQIIIQPIYNNGVPQTIIWSSINDLPSNYSTGLILLPDVRLKIENGLQLTLNSSATIRVNAGAILFLDDVTISGSNNNGITLDAEVQGEFSRLCAHKVKFNNCSYAVTANDFAYVVIRKSLFQNCIRGITINNFRNASLTHIYANSFTWNSNAVYQIKANNSENLRIYGNIFNYYESSKLTSGKAIWLTNCSNSYICRDRSTYYIFNPPSGCTINTGDANTFTNIQEAIVLNTTNNIKILSNTFLNCKYGVKATSDFQTIIYNNLFECTIIDDEPYHIYFVQSNDFKILENLFKYHFDNCNQSTYFYSIYLSNPDKLDPSNDIIKSLIYHNKFEYLSSCGAPLINPIYIASMYNGYQTNVEISCNDFSNTKFRIYIASTSGQLIDQGSQTSSAMNKFSNYIDGTREDIRNMTTSFTYYTHESTITGVFFPEITYGVTINTLANISTCFNINHCDLYAGAEDLWQDIPNDDYHNNYPVCNTNLVPVPIIEKKIGESGTLHLIQGLFAIHIYPNPANSFFQVIPEFDSSFHDVRIIIKDMFNREIKMVKCDYSNMQITLEKEELNNNGIFIIQMIDTDGNKIEKKVILY